MRRDAFIAALLATGGGVVTESHATAALPSVLGRLHMKEHIMKSNGAPLKPVIKSTTKARGGVTGHNVRYVLALALAGTIMAFVVIAVYFGAH
jgi:hypothetical protein